MENPNNIKNFIEKAKSFRNQEKYEEALEILDLLYQRNPNSLDVKRVLIETLFDYGGYLNDIYTLEYEKAMQSFKRITEMSPNNYRAHYNLGLAYFNLGQLENAKNSFKTALNIKPDYKYCFYNLGLLHESKQLYEEALDYYEKALEIDPNFPYALTAQSQIRRKLDELRRKKIT
jgi:tetratricopeptide (TPR) repeat protein